MTLAHVIRDSIALTHALGSRFHAEAVLLKAFSRRVGAIPMTGVTAEHVNAYLDGHGPVTRLWHRKHSALPGLYRFAIGRGSVRRSPVPTTTPKVQGVFTPYLY